MLILIIEEMKDEGNKAILICILTYLRFYTSHPIEPHTGKAPNSVLMSNQIDIHNNMLSYADF